MHCFYYNFVGNLNKQEKLLNAVALIQQVLESSFSSEHRKEANKTELSKLTREVFPAAKKETLASEFSPIEEAISGHNEETDKAERYSNEKGDNKLLFLTLFYSEFHTLQGHGASRGRRLHLEVICVHRSGR